MRAQCLPASGAGAAFDGSAAPQRAREWRGTKMSCFKMRFVRRLALGFSAACLWMLAAPPASAATGVGISHTLEGCRPTAQSPVTFPDNGPFICPDNLYTTGNLGKSWNELDLVPGRVTLKAGNSAPATQLHAFVVAVDNMDAARPGYDVLSEVTLNAGKSSASCSAAISSAPAYLQPGVGGTDSTLYRTVTVTQDRNTTCVYDFYARLALGAHLYPGASLHFNLLNEQFDTGGIGAKDVSIPVKEILPQSLRKDMTAKADSDHQWTLQKTASTDRLDFGDVCSVNSPTSLPVQVTVTWTRSAGTQGNVNITTHVYAKNPAARTITVAVTDVIYKGTDQSTTLDTANSGNVDVPAVTESLVLTHTVSLPPNVAGAVGDYLNDVATATYTDKATGLPVPGTTTATASTQITAGVDANTAANITDSESITGSALTFSAAAPNIGAYTNYTAGTPTVGPVLWSSDIQTSSGQVVFDKTVMLSPKKITSGALSDTAYLVTTDTVPIALQSGPVTVNIVSNAKAKLTVSKSIPDILGAGERIEVTFHISRANDATYSRDVTLTFTGGGSTSQNTDLTGLVPDQYTVTETSAVFFPNGCNDSSCSFDAGLTPVGGNQQAVDLSADADGVVAHCTGTAAFVNEVRQGAFPQAQVQKITDPVLTGGDPDYNWTFTLTGPGAFGSVQAIAGAGAGYVNFGVPINLEGNYTVAETQKTGWDENSAVPSGGGNPPICAFTVNLPQDQGALFSCTFKNTKRGHAKVVKTVLNAPPAGSQAFTFQLRQGATPTDVGTTLESLVANAGNGGVLNFGTTLVPGQTYQLCEIVMPGWLTTLGDFVPNSFLPPDGVPANPNVDNSILCGNVTVAAGETKTFSIDNSPPPGGRALTIGFWRNWASCSDSKGKQKPTLDQTMYKMYQAGNRVFAGTPNGVTSVIDGVVGMRGENANATRDCPHAVSLLSKKNFSGKSQSSDPLFNMAAQLVAAELNIGAGAYTCPTVATAIITANGLLSKYNFNGTTHGKVTAADATLANNTAKTLDDYNNNRPGVCQ
jgi:hypothetical protein